jgi:hypothetical protein
MPKKFKPRDPRDRPESSLTRDFVSGIDPSGGLTYNLSMGNRKNHGAHAAAAMTGGAISGAALIPSALMGGIAAVRTKGNFAARMAAAWQGAKKPYMDLYHGQKVTNALRRASTTGRAVVDDGLKKSVEHMYGEAAGFAKEHLPIGGSSINGAHQLTQGQMTAAGKMHASAAETLGQTKALIAGSAAVSAGSAGYQYVQGQKQQRTLDALYPMQGQRKTASLFREHVKLALWKLGERDPPSTHRAVTSLARKSGIEWDGDEKFMELSHAVVGKEHLDDMTPEELGRLRGAIKDGGGAAKGSRWSRWGLEDKTLSFDEAKQLTHFMVAIDRPIGHQKRTGVAALDKEYPVNYGEAMGRNNVADNWDWDCIVPGVVLPRKRILAERVVGWITDSRGNHKLIAKPYGVSVDDPLFQGQVSAYLSMRRELDPSASVEWITGLKKESSRSRAIVRGKVIDAARFGRC